MRTVKDPNLQERQFFFKIGRNKPTWNSPITSPVNSTALLREKSSQLHSNKKRNAPPTVDTNIRPSISKQYTNEIPRTGSSLGARQSIQLLDKSSAGKAPGYIMNEIQSALGRTFEVSVASAHNVSPMSNLLKVNSAIVDEKVRITLQPLGQGSGTQLLRNRSLNESQDNLKYFLNKRSISKQYDANESITKLAESHQSVLLPMNKGILTKKIFRPKESKVNKILREVKSNIESDEGSRAESPFEREQHHRAPSMKNSFTIKTKSPLIKSPRNKEHKVEVIENKHTNNKGTGLPKKFVSYRNVLDSQILTFNKARAPLMNQSKDQSIDTSVEIASSDAVPAFFKNMKANLSARNHEVRQKFAKTINFILRKLGLLGLTLDEVINNKPFPSEPYEHIGSKAFIDAAKIGDISEIETLLILYPYLVYAYDPLKQTALHWAAKRGHTKIMKILLEKGADPDARDVSGRTPLFGAARASLVNSVKILLYYAANPMLKSGAGRLAIDYANELHVKSLLTRGYKLHAFLGTYSSKRFNVTWKLLDKHEFEVKDAELE